MARKAATRNVEPEEESQEVPEVDTEASGGDRAGRGVPTKADAIRRALAEGIESPEEGVDFIRRTFGLDVSRQHFSASKSRAKQEQGGAQPAEPARRGRKPKEAPAQAVAGTPDPGPKPSAPVEGEANLLAALETMKPLVAALGADKVKRIVDILG